MSAACQVASGHPVLIVDDEPGTRTALEITFRRRGWPVECAAGKNEALARMRLRQPALVVSDIRMPDGDGFELMQAARKISAGTPVILLTGFGSVPDAVTAMKSGACEYFTKPIAYERLLESAERILSRRSTFATQDAEIIGSSPLLMQTLNRARQAAESDADVLIEAESGTGKELLARMIHRLSPRRDYPFIALNCAAVPEALLESEFFGHARGAFTGAACGQAGKFQLADNGTLLLDEIGEMPLGLQPKLLRVLQQREFYPLGENRAVRINVRIISTSNRPLAAMVSNGSFRADLYYRLNVIPLTLPPLRERPEDIRELALHFAHEFAVNTAFHLPESFLSQLEGRSWPGNVRELSNFMRRVAAIGVPGSESSCFPPDLDSDVSYGPKLDVHRPDREAHSLHPGMSLAGTERKLFELTLNATGGNRSRAAEMLGVSLRTVRNKIREFNLPPRSDYARD